MNVHGGKVIIATNAATYRHLNDDKRYNIRGCPGAASTARGLADLRKQADVEQLTFDQYAAEVGTAEVGATVKLCECGCGRPTRIATRNHVGHGYVKGEPMRFVRGHAQRRSRNQARSAPAIDFRPLCTELLPSPGVRAWVYAFWNADRELLYVGKVVRLSYMGRLDEHSHKAPWWGEVVFFSAQEVPVADVAEAESQAIRTLRPKYNLSGTAQCGTLSGYKRHRARHEQACQPCIDALNAFHREERRKNGVGPAPVSQCGTYGGYFAHLRRDELPCDLCKEAAAEYHKNRSRRMQDAQQAP